MKLTTRGEYALLSLVYLARRLPGELVPAKDISAAQSIPLKYLEHILSALKRSRYLRSVKGPKGGYALFKPAEEITLAEIIRLLDGPLAATGSASIHFYQRTPLAADPALTRVFAEIRDLVADKLERTTLADVARPSRARPGGGGPRPGRR